MRHEPTQICTVECYDGKRNEDWLKFVQLGMVWTSGDQLLATWHVWRTFCIDCRHRTHPVAKSDHACAIRLQ
jgi:hypothetical protein